MIMASSLFLSLRNNLFLSAKSYKAFPEHPDSKTKMEIFTLFSMKPKALGLKRALPMLMPISGHHSTREPRWEQSSCVETSESFLFPQDGKWRHFHSFSASLMGKQESSWNGLFSLSNSSVERNYNLLPESSTYRAFQEEALKSVASDCLGPCYLTFISKVMPGEGVQIYWDLLISKSFLL